MGRRFFPYPQVNINVEQHVNTLIILIWCCRTRIPMGAFNKRKTSSGHDETGCVFRYKFVIIFHLTWNTKVQQSKITNAFVFKTISDSQRKGLEKRFQIQKYISKPDRKKLAERLGLKDSQVCFTTDWTLAFNRNELKCVLNWRWIDCNKSRRSLMGEFVGYFDLCDFKRVWFW